MGSQVSPEELGVRRVNEEGSGRGNGCFKSLQEKARVLGDKVFQKAGSTEYGGIKEW